jgi:hypothetical protein
MKRLPFFFLIVFGFLIFATPACKDKETNPIENCEVPELAINIIGQWNSNDIMVEFKSDGTIDDPENIIIDSEIIGQQLDFKSYSVESETLLVITSANADGSVSSTQDVNVTESACDVLRLDFQGNYNLTLTR